MASLSDRDLRQGLADLTDLAKRDLRDALARAKTPIHARTILGDVMADLIDAYGTAAATLAADWYDDTRERLAISGAFTAIPAEINDTGAQALLGWALDSSTDLKTFETLTLGGYTRRILRFGRATVTRSSVADPGARGWQRTGAGECGFCRMLIGRGAVYGESTADFASHDHCNCSAVPAFNGEPIPVKPFTPSARDISDADRARVKAWIAANQ